MASSACRLLVMSSASATVYDDDYKTCRATHATLRIVSVAPEEVTRVLGLSRLP